MPRWMRRDECEDVPAPKSDLSTSAVRNPRNAASRAIPAPVMPPPITSRSNGVSDMDAKVAARVCSNSPPLGAGGRFRLPGEGKNLMPGLNGRRVAVEAVAEAELKEAPDHFASIRPAEQNWIKAAQGPPAPHIYVGPGGRGFYAAEGA